jgi:hypothetical protein
MGRSAILLGYLLDAPNERFVVCDVFDDDVADEGSWRPNGVAKPRREDFTTNYLRFHRELPVVIAGESRRLDPHTLGPRRFRLIYVDGAHDWVNVQADIALAQALAADDAVLVFDDVWNRGYPAVGASVWSQVVSGALYPIATTNKLYAAATPHSPVVDTFRELISDASDLRTTARAVNDAEVLVVSQQPDARSPVGRDARPVQVRGPRRAARTPSWKHAARDLCPPLLYRGMSRLSTAARRRRAEGKYGT